MDKYLKKSLKPIKKKMAQTDNIFRTIKHVYPHLDELSNQEILNYYGLTSSKELEKHVERIKDILLKREIDSIKELDKIEGCFCLDSKKEFKYLYITKKEAEEQIAYTSKTKRIKLALYPCPYHFGWHLHKI